MADQEMYPMNTPDTQNANVPTAAESQFLQSSLLAMAQARSDNAPSEPPALSATPTMAGLLRALKRRWGLALGVAVGTTFLAVAAVFLLMPPKYNVALRVRVVAKQGGPEDIEFPIFKASMEALVKRPLVLNAALNDKAADGRDIKDLEIVRTKGLGAVEWLEKNLKTDYLLGPEELRITLAAEHPGEAADLLNAIGKAFLNEYAEMERSKKQQRVDDLRRQKEGIEADLGKLRTTLEKQLKELDLKDRDAAAVQLQQWQNKLAAAEASRRVLNDEFAKAEGKILTSNARLKTIDKQPIPESVLFELYTRDAGIASFDQRLAKLQEEYDDYLARFPPEYAEKKKQEQIKVAKQKSEREVLLKPMLEQRWRENERTSLEYGISAAELDKQDFKLRLERVGKEIQEFERRIKEFGPGGINEPSQILATREKIEGKKKALEYTGQKISDVELEALPSRVIPIQAAAPPLDKDRAQQTKIAGAGGLSIFVLALFGVAFFEFRSRKISQPDEVTRGLGINVLGTVPAIPARSKNPSAKDAEAEAAWLGQLHESVDAIRTVLLHQARNESLHIIMISSASSGEGKTTLATQLGASLSRAWKRTLVIDADLRHPGTHVVFDTPQEPGLAEVLRGETDPADAIRATAHSRLWLLPAGNGDAHAIQALAQDNVRTLFEQLKQQFDFIIIDAPPVLPVTDSLLIGQHVDGVLFAILSDVSRAPAVFAAQQKLAPLAVRSLGAVILGAESEFGDKQYRYAGK
jgi:capsular exopolysaccharide synthesis family protein